MTRQAAQIIPFPFSPCEADECETYGDAVFQLKMKAARLLNDANEGTYVMTDENRAAIRDVNRRCHEVGLSPLDFE